jgi:hypothetical protein
LIDSSEVGRQVLIGLRKGHVLEGISQVSELETLSVISLLELSTVDLRCRQLVLELEIRVGPRLGNRNRVSLELA